MTADEMIPTYLSQVYAIVSLTLFLREQPVQPVRRDPLS